MADQFTDRYGKWAMVAGAAEGIGAAFSEVLAKRRMNLVMVDFHPASLKEVAERTERNYGIQTIQIVLDLAENGAAQHCMSSIDGLDCRLLVYIPAYSRIKSFLDNSPEELDQYLHLNVRTPLHLVYRFAGKIRNSAPGGIILMSSLAGLIGPQFSAIYSGTKAFSILLAEALFPEFKRCHIDVLACCAGTTNTPTFWSSRPEGQGNKMAIMDPMVVAEYALSRLGRKAICIPGLKNRLIYFLLTRILPRKTASFIVSREMEKMYPSRLAL